MITLIACADIPSFYSKAFELIKSSAEKLEFLDLNEIRSDKTRYLRICTGYEILNATRLYADVQIMLLPCYVKLPDKFQIDRALTTLKVQKSYQN